MKKIFALYSVVFLFLIGGCTLEKHPFPDPEELPEVETISVTNITLNTADCGGIVISGGASELLARGVCWAVNPEPTIHDFVTTDGTGTGSFASILTGLDLHTTYWVRAYATNHGGTSYGEAVEFKSATVKDFDGNLYHFIGIGTQIWMIENLRVTRFNDGDIITNVTSTAWGNITTPSMAWYDNDEATSKEAYGALYNYYAVNTGKLCPPGWHVPTHAEWQQLVTLLGDTGVAGGSLKDTTAYWLSPNTGATNQTGFTARPGGYREWTDEAMGEEGWWWTATDSSAMAWAHRMSYNNTFVSPVLNAREKGFSVRCIKD